MADLKISVQNNMVVFQQSGDKIPFGRAKIEPRYTDTHVIFVHDEENYLGKGYFEGGQEKFLFSEIKDGAGAALPVVGPTLKDDVQSYLSDKVGNFKPAGGGTASTITTDTSDDQEIIFDNAGVLDGSHKLKWDDTNRELGISKDQIIGIVGSIKFGSDFGSPAIGSGLIDQKSNNLFVGGVSNNGVETGLLFSGTSSGVDAFRIMPNVDNQIDLGKPGLEFRDFYGNAVRTLIGNFDTSVTVGLLPTEDSAILTVGSTTQGVLIPRMTTAQKNAIVSPATGLQVHDTDLNRPEYYDGTQWQAFHGASLSVNVLNKTFVDSGYVAGNYQSLIVDASGGNTTIFLPVAANSTNFHIKVKKEDGSVNKVIVDGNGAELIDGQTTYELNVFDQGAVFECNGTRWYIF